MSSHSVLIVDDDAAMCQMLVEALRDSELTASYALDVDGALRLLEDEPFRVIVCDIQLSPRDGFELLRVVRLQESAPPVILMTAFATDDTARRAREAGAFGFLKKPFLPAQFSALVERAISP